jgi:hypothetical protein
VERKIIVVRNLLLFCLALISGCGPLISPSPVKPDVRPDIVEDRATAADIWRVLANRVECRSITSSQRLAQFVVVMARQGDLSPDDVAAFDRSFPGAANSDRPLVADDAAKLRALP